MKTSSFLALLAPAALLIGGTAPSAAQSAATPVETVAPVPDVPERLDLRNAIAYALENNYSIQQARERIKEQEGLIVEVKAKTIPHLGLASSYKKKDQELVQSAGSDQDWSIALEARQVLYAGGGISAALEAQKQQGVTQRLVLLSVEGSPLILHDEPVLENGLVVGLTTSGAKGVRCGLTLALALVSVAPGAIEIRVSEK
jgi:outer membrane protein TolC